MPYETACPALSTEVSGVETRGLGGPARVLVMVEQSLIADVIELTLNHGVYATRKATNLAEATIVLDEWQPHLAVVDMDIGGDHLVQRLEHPETEGRTRIPTLALTRHGDLRTRLAAFEQGVDDIMTIPFSPEESPSTVQIRSRSGDRYPTWNDGPAVVGEPTAIGVRISSVAWTSAVYIRPIAARRPEGSPLNVPCSDRSRSAYVALNCRELALTGEPAGSIAVSGSSTIG